MLDYSVISNLRQRFYIVSGLVRKFCNQSSVGSASKGYDVRNMGSLLQHSLHSVKLQESSTTLVILLRGLAKEENASQCSALYFIFVCLSIYLLIFPAIILLSAQISFDFTILLPLLPTNVEVKVMNHYTCFQFLFFNL